MSTIKKIGITSGGKNVEKTKSSFTAGGNLKWCGHVWKQLPVSYQVKHKFTTWPNKFIPGVYAWEIKPYIHILICECS